MPNRAKCVHKISSLFAGITFNSRRVATAPPASRVILNHLGFFCLITANPSHIGAPGLGFLGCVTAACFATLRLRAIGIVTHEIMAIPEAASL